MFRISRRIDYAFQLMQALANQKDTPISSARLSAELKIPLPFTHQIAHALMQAGLIKASPGSKGGLRLGRSPSDISLLDIMEALEGPIRLSPCLEDKSTCPHSDTCLFLPIWASLQQSLNASLKNITLEHIKNRNHHQILNSLGSLELSIESCRQPTAA